MPFTPQTPARERNDPLGPTTVNQAQANIVAVDDLALVEHFNDGQHNALEVPWVLGHIDDGSPPTGYLLDTAFGGGTLARPATGRYTSSIVSGVITSDAQSNLLAATMANISDSAIEAKPHTITVEPVSATSLQFRVRELNSALGAGNTWADVNRDFDFGLHAPAQTADPSLLTTSLQKVRRDTLTDQATDWNALVVNQGIVRKAAPVEHTAAGLHKVNRIAKGAGWFRPSSGPSFGIVSSQGVASVSRVSLGVVAVTMSDNFTSTNTMACFPEGQPANKDELVIVNGRGFNTGAGTSVFRFYIYVYSAGSWARADRAFFAPMFGVIA